VITTGFAERKYREDAAPEGLVSFRVTIEQTDLWIAARTDLAEKAYESVHRHRSILEEYISVNPDFFGSLKPLDADSEVNGLVREMINAGKQVGIGPMSAVAGTIAEAVARDLIRESSTVIVENGGDLYLMGNESRVISIWAGESPLSRQLGIEVHPGEGLAVCTSSGTVGPSLSFGSADAAVVLSASGALADAAATDLGNRISSSEDIERALEQTIAIDGALGAVVVIGDAVGAMGEVEIVPL
jgi:ApbE superfamily uncharacterized protein (UPF0280 family)